MENETRKSMIDQRLLRLLLSLLLIAFLVTTALAFKTKFSSGILDAKGTSPTASLEVAQTNYQARVIGYGRVSVRLKPGSYQLIYTENGASTTTAFTIYKGRTTTMSASLSGGQPTNTKPAVDKIFTLLPHYTNQYLLYAQPTSSGKPNIVFYFLAPIPVPANGSRPSQSQGNDLEPAAISAAKTWLTQNGINLDNYTFIITGS